MANFNEINYSLNYLHELVQTFGYSRNTFDFYLRQIENLRNINQIRVDTYDVIKKLLANVDSYESLEKRASNYVEIINLISSGILGVEDIVKMKSEESDVNIAYECAAITYGYKSIDALRRKVQLDIEIEKAKKKAEREVEALNNHIKDIQTKLLRVLSTSCDIADAIREEKLEIRVKNNNAVCSGDPSYYIYNLVTGFNKKILSILLKEEYYDFGFNKKLPTSLCGYDYNSRTHWISLDRKILRDAFNFVVGR